MTCNSPNGWTSTIIDAGQHIEWKNNITTDILLNSQLSSSVTQILKKALKGERISIDQALTLHNECDLPTLGRVAHVMKLARYEHNIFFNRNLHINHTNVCVLACRFCAFRRGPKADDSYSLSVEEYITRIEPFSELITEVHSVGGLHHEWTIEHYESLFRATKNKYPGISIKALTAVEIQHLASLSDLTILDVLKRLKLAGLDTIPGGGAEILVDEVREIICKGKESSSEYLAIHQSAHELGIPTNCTMLFGTVETIRHRLIHLDKLRALQDKTHGFQCFVPYPFLPDKSRLPEAQLATANEILRTIAISRIMLDNIPHIKSYRMNLGDNIGALALLHGADDIDGTVGNEEIMHLAGSSTPLDQYDDDLAKLIEGVGGIPVERNTNYTIFSRYRKQPPPDNKGLPLAHS
jgi:aminodeoxyfutalosine synthase